jgi:plastocyanin
MKKIYSLLFISLLTGSSAFSTIHIFDVNASDFSPFSLGSTVGDTIRWVWTGGTHNTVSGSIPSGAVAWSSPISTAVPQFDYVVSVEGVYLFACTIHNFYGQFSVAAPNGINTPIPQINFLVSSKDNSNYTFSYNLLGNAKVELLLADMTGKVVRVLFTGEKPGGEYVENYYLEELRTGIYILQMYCDNQRLTRRILIK